LREVSWEVKAILVFMMKKTYTCKLTSSLPLLHIKCIPFANFPALSMAVEFALETSNVNGATLHTKRHHFSPSTPTNPYILPFALRGLLEEDYVRHELHQESMELLKQFDEWKPTTKVLKDVKFRLEGIRSKL
jgi:hypothetical protein